MPRLPEILVFFGLIASGKSTLGQALAAERGLRYCNSDVLRKELAAAELRARGKNEAYGAGLYGPEFTRKTYDALLACAEEELRRGRGVVLDASYQSREERQRVRELAARFAAPVHFIFCSCPEPLLKERMERRARDPSAVSDGRWEIYLLQKERFEVPEEPEACLRIDTNDTIANLLPRLERLLERAADGRDRTSPFDTPAGAGTKTAS